MRSVAKMIGLASIGLSLGGSAQAQSIPLTSAACGKLLPSGTYHLNYNLSCPAGGPKLQSNTTIRGNGFGPVRHGSRSGVGWSIKGAPTTPVQNVRLENVSARGYLVGVEAMDVKNLWLLRTLGQSAFVTNSIGVYAKRVSSLVLSGIAAPANDAAGIILDSLSYPKVWNSSANSNGGPGLILNMVKKGDLRNNQFRRNSGADVIIQNASSYNQLQGGIIDHLRLETGAAHNRAHCVTIGRATSDGTAVDNTATCP